MMTKERLVEAQHTVKQIRLLQKQIEASYNTYHSPKFDGVKSSAKNTDPVTNALYKIDRLHEELAECYESLLPFLDDLMQIPSSVIRSIIIEHYLLGYSWERCTEETLGINRSDSARISLYRYLKKSKEEI